ncbi:MAG: hypothetical protein J5527_04565 [Treponema sp.]|nr:hypothetical protein [Treponema sp.]
MKKLLAVLFVAAVMVAGLFAEEFPKGTWIDSNYNAEWVIGADMSIKLYDATDGSLIQSFAKDKMQNEKLEVTEEGLVYQFYYKDTYRRYYFIKPVRLVPDANLLLQIDPDWTTTDYKVDIKFKK